MSERTPVHSTPNGFQVNQIVLCDLFPEIGTMRIDRIVRVNCRWGEDYYRLHATSTTCGWQYAEGAEGFFYRPDYSCGEERTESIAQAHLDAYAEYIG